jgi:ADP-heptose:LPS heptosyltransferase
MEASQHEEATMTWARFEHVRRIAVLRGGGLGDLVFALPAIQALRDAYPEARITLLGTGRHRELLDGRPGPIDRVEVLPHAEGVQSDGVEDAAGRERFFRDLRAGGVDLACQLHGGGRFANPFLLRLGARHTIGLRTRDAVDLERTLPYVYYQHEVARWLEVASLAGASGAIVEPRLAVTAAERALGTAARRDAGRPLLVIHPGATDPRRRWPPERFAQLAASFAREGWQVTTVGSGDDAGLADRVAELADQDLVDSAGGRLTLGGLLGLFSAATVVVGNDSGPRHLAQAVGAATVGLFWIGNVLNGAPLSRARNRVEMSWTTVCPVCGIDVTQVGWTAPRCEHDVSFVDDIPLDAVRADVDALAASRP